LGTTRVLIVGITLRKCDEKPEVDARRTESLLIAHSFDVFLEKEIREFLTKMLFIKWFWCFIEVVQEKWRRCLS